MLLFAIARFFVRLFFDLILGVANRLLGYNKAPTGKSVRVWKIRYKSKAFDVGPAERSNFWCTHSHWDTAELILEKDVTLYSLNAQYVYFVKSRPNVDLASAHAFYYFAQYENAEQFIQVPIADFHRIAQKIGDPKGEMVFLFSTGRCGSTLLQQMLSALPRTVSLSEPDSFTHTHVLKNQGLSTSELKTVMQSVVRIEGKRCTQGERLVLKTRSQCTWQAGLVAELFPRAHLLFMYRNAIDVTFSNVRAFMHLPGLGLSFNESIPEWLREKVLAAPLKGFIFKTTSHLYPLEYLKTLPVLPLVATGWVVECLRYVELRQQGVKINAIRYEDLIATPESAFRAIAKHIGVELTPEIVRAALDEMKKDSQEGSSISLSARAKTVFTDKDRLALLDVLAHKQLAPDAILEGTLTTEMPVSYAPR